MKKIQKKFEFFKEKVIFLCHFLCFSFRERWPKITIRGLQKKRYTFKMSSSWRAVQYKLSSLPLRKNIISKKNSHTNWFFQNLPKKYKPFFGNLRVYKNRCIFFVVMLSSWIVPHLTYILLIVSIAGRFKQRQNDRFWKGKQPRPDRPSIVPEIQGRWRDDHLAL